MKKQKRPRHKQKRQKVPKSYNRHITTNKQFIKSLLLILEDKILMVETVNLVHHEFKETQEIKALSNEIVKTIRELITLNPIMRYSTFNLDR